MHNVLGGRDDCLKEMSPEQQELARRILRTALSERGCLSDHHHRA
jgi:hypothetical protein